MSSDDLILESPMLEGLIEPYAESFPRSSDFEGYRNHCLRMLNVALALSRDEPDRRVKLEVALAFHDITVFPERTLDYLDGSAAHARRHLSEIGRDDWADEITLMITQHHKITPYRGIYENLVDAVRMADWVDLSMRVFKFGLPAQWLHELDQQLPLLTFYPRALAGVVVGYFVRHPLRPLPNFRL